MTKMIFVSLPVADLRASIAFYKAHGAVQIAASDGEGNEEKLPDLTLLIPQA